METHISFMVLFFSVFSFGDIVHTRGIDKVLRHSQEERWLDNEQHYDRDYPGDSPAGAGLVLEDNHGTVDDRHEECSPLPNVHIKDACRAPPCQGHSDCRNQNERCCFNGCVRTCLKQRDPPPFIDWIKEPRSRTRSGVSWLVNGPSSSEDLELCTTSKVGKNESPLLCPHGYVCHVIRRGNARKRIPNVGHCVPKNDKNYFNDPTKKDSELPLSSCLVDKYVLLNGAFLYLSGQKCVCKDGYLTCLDKKT